MLGLNVGRKIGSVGGRARDQVLLMIDTRLLSVAVPYDAFNCKPPQKHNSGCITRS